jgi:hypothetical protein
MKEAASPPLPPTQILALSSAGCLAILGVHVFADGSHDLGFLAWNLFLA